MRTDLLDQDTEAVEAMLSLERPELVPLPDSRPETPLDQLARPDPTDRLPSTEAEPAGGNDTKYNEDEEGEEAKLCRICFGGELDEPELGRLISPCVCRGTARHVHVACLAQWRQSSASKKAFYVCPQCSFEYRFARTRVAGLATNKSAFALAVTSVVIFLVLTLGTGQLLHVALDRSRGSPYEDLLLPSRSLYGSTTALELVREAITVFASGEAELLFERAVKGVSTFLTPSPPEPTPAVASSPLAWVADLFRSATIAVEVPPEPSLLRAIKERFLLGLGALGAVGALASVLGSSAMPFVSMLNTLRLPIPFIGGGRRRIGGGGGTAARAQGPGIGAVLVVSLVFFGGVQVVKSLNRTLRRTAEWVLLRAETAVLDVGGDPTAISPVAAALEDDVARQPRRRWLLELGG